MAGKPRVIVVVGATGIGKTRLGVEVAAAVGGEVVNADAMQLYAGLDLLTNKATPAERAAAPHHLLGVADPLAPPLTVHAFLAFVDDVIARLAAAGKPAVVVGGTHYYIEALLHRRLCPDPLAPPHGEQGGEDGAKAEGPAAEDLHAQLRAVDPEMAQRLHPRDTRKIARSLAVFRASGVPHSALIAQQAAQPPTQPYSACVLWLDTTSTAALDARVDRRVDAMLAGGLLAEVAELRARYEAAHGVGSAPDFEHGVFQAIGVRDLWVHPPGSAGPEFEAAVARMKTRTRQYVRTQAKWVAKRLAPASRPLLHLCWDCSLGQGEWDSKVNAPAVSMARAFLAGTLPEEAPAPPASGPPPIAQTCAVCNKVLFGAAAWQAHTRSQRHRALVRKLKIKAANPPAPAAAAEVEDSTGRGAEESDDK